MAKSFKIFVMIFALGIFMVPKQMLFAQNIEMSCCKKEKSSKDCCDASEKSTPSKDSKNKQHSCNGNCANCTSCAFTVVFLGEEINQFISKNTLNTISNKVENFYLIPYFLQLSKAIWQPPKIS